MKPPRAERHDFPDRQTLARELAATVAARLAEAVARRGDAVLVVSGGSTPVAFFEALSHERIPWDKVVITLADERFVPPEHPRSNERLAREWLLRNKAEAARFVGLGSGAGTIADAARTSGETICALRLPFDVVILGMGLDGHTASIFPDAGNLTELTAMQTSAPVLPVHSGNAGEPRLSLTLAWLLRAHHIIVHIEGQEKRALLETCLSGEIEPMPPIASVFAQAGQAVEIYWAPAGESP